MENENLMSKKERDEQKTKQRSFNRIIIWSLALLVVFGSGFGLFKLSQIEKISPTGDASVLEVTGRDITIGSPEASLVLVEYSDFQCPSCAAYHPVVKEIMSEYGDNLLFVYRHFPLPQHFNAAITAAAAEAAGRQNKFWEMHDLIFTRQTEWSSVKTSDMEEVLTGYAKELDLDLVKFEADLENEEIKNKVTGDLASGRQAGVTGTPNFFLNGEKISPRTLNDFRSILDEAYNQVSTEEN